MNVLITGASGDIGRAIARAFQGHDLILQYHSAGPQFAAEFPGALAVKCDLREERQVQALFEKAREAFGPIQILINNCGISGFGLFDDLTLSQWNDMLHVNLTSAFLASREAAKDMIKAKRGAIVNIASMWGEVGASCEVHYSAAKGGLIAMTKALAKELAMSGIRVNCVSPGYIETRMNGRLSPEEKAAFLEEIPLGRAGTPEDVAEAVRFLAESAPYITGQVLGVNGGYVI